MLLALVRSCGALLCVVTLIGCANNSYSPAYDSLKTLIATDGGQATIPDKPDLRFGYLRVQVGSYPPGLLVLGYVDPHPAGEVEVWYSGNQEALRLQNGRVVGVTGALHDWQSVGLSPVPPNWTELGTQPARYERRRDVMPGYRYGVLEAMRVEALPGLPATELLASLPQEKAQTYRWFRESAEPLAGQPGNALPAAWFAWGRHRGVDTIVYSEQCLAPDFCLKLQRWPVLEEEP